MNHLGLFEGIGGFSLAAQWMGWETKAYCEWNPFCQKVLMHHFPEAEGFEDITKTDFTKYANKIDIITGGFPCQPYSVAGKRKGKEDERHLWPEMLRAIREVQPRWVVGENVLGLVNWDGGLVFHEVQTDLEAAGYEVWPYVLPACATNAPHRRDRVWFIAYPHSNRNRYNGTQDREKNCLQGISGETIHTGELAGTDTGNVTNTNSQSGQPGVAREWQEFGQKREQIRSVVASISKIGDVANANDKGMEGLLSRSEEIGQSVQEKGKPWNSLNSGICNWIDFPTQSPLCGGNDGLPSKLDGITFSKWRNESIKAYGNAIVPQVALQIFKAIEQFEINIKS
jgi:DNA (cytosine-5)-methyltransferase 1